jgi:hypothetical protein
VKRGEGAPVHVVVTCTKRKTRPPSAGLQLHETAAATPEARAEAWITRLHEATGDFVPARDLYAGDHWSVALSIPDAAPTLDIRLWVCSAGYGLLPVDTLIAPYSATFSATHPDAVHRGLAGVPRAEVLRRWWEQLAQWEGPEPGRPRTLLALAEAHPDASLLIVASAPYLRALSADLADARKALRSPDKLSIVSAAARHLKGLAESVVPFDRRLQQVLRGADMSLNVRVARELLLNGAEPVRSSLAHHAELLSRGLKRRETIARPSQTDDEVRGFIRGELAARPQARWSPLLRKLRTELGLGCEQKRFKQLFLETAAENVAGIEPDDSREIA